MKQLRIALIAAAAAAVLVPSAALAAPQSLSGTWDDCNFGAVVRSAGPNFVATVGITENFQGAMSGTYAGTEQDVIYADGSATFQGSGTFTGTIASRSGTAGYRYEGVAPAGAPFHAHWVLIGTTGSLVGVVGQGTFGGSFDGTSDVCDAGIFSGTYAGQVNVS